MEFDLAMSQAGFIAQRVLPVLGVAKQAGNFGLIPIEQLLQARTTDRAPGSHYNSGTFTFNPATYSTNEHGWEEPVDDSEAEMFSEYFVLEQIAAMRAFRAVLENYEKRVAAAIFNTSTWTGAALTTAVGTPWSTVATAVPTTNVEAAAQKVFDNCGMWPNAIIMSRKTFRNVRNCVSIIDRIKFAGITDPRAGAITEAAIAQVFDLDHVIVAGSAKNTAIEGQAAAISSIWADTNVMVCKIATDQDIRTPCIGRTFHWGEDGSQVGGQVETYRDEGKRSDIVRVRHQVDEKVLYVEAGHLLTNT
jgi:hypothetical protein